MINRADEVEGPLPLWITDRLRDALASHIANPECRRQPEAHFLLPKTGARLSFACLPK